MKPTLSFLMGHDLNLKNYNYYDALRIILLMLFVPTFAIFLNSSAQASLSLGKQYYEAGDYKSAIEQLRLASIEYSNSSQYRIEALSLLGDSYARLGKKSSANQSYVDAINIANTRLRLIKSEVNAATGSAAVAGSARNTSDNLQKVNELNQEQLKLKGLIKKLREKIAAPSAVYVKESMLRASDRDAHKSTLASFLSQMENWEKTSDIFIEECGIETVYTDYMRYRISIEEIDITHRMIHCLLQLREGFGIEIVAYRSHSNDIIELVSEIARQGRSTKTVPTLYVIDADKDYINNIGRRIAKVALALDVSAVHTEDGWFILLGDLARQVNQFIRN